MKRDRGSGLSPEVLEGFIRMISSSIPEESFNRIGADVCLEVDPERRLRHLRVRSWSQESLSSVSATGYTNPCARPLSTDLPIDMARCAATAALAFQVAWRWLRLPFDVFFFGTAMNA